MFQRTYKYIRDNNMVSDGDTVLVGLSAGADSTALLYILSKLKEQLHINIYAAHLNHGLRDAAYGDAEFAKKLCKDFGITLFSEYIDVKSIMETEKLSMEVAARNARLGFLRDTAKKVNAQHIAVAHHSADRAETMLLNLVRGSGLTGLTAMKPVDGKIIRPLLFAGKQDITDLLSEQGINWREDESNKDNSIPRNMIRNVVIKKLGGINSSVVNSMNSTAGLLSRDEDYFDSIVMGFEDNITRSDNGYHLGFDVIDGLHPSILSRVIRLFAVKNGVYRNIHAVNIEQVMELVSTRSVGNYINWPNGLRAYIENDGLWIGYVSPIDDASTALNIDGVTSLGDYEFHCAIVDKLPKDFISRTPHIQYVDRKGIVGVNVRYRQDGDVITPIGMQGTKLLSDYMTDRKVPRRKKDSLPVFVKDNKVLFVTDVGIGEELKVTDDTKTIIKVEFIRKNR